MDIGAVQDIYDSMPCGIGLVRLISGNKKEAELFYVNQALKELSGLDEKKLLLKCNQIISEKADRWAIMFTETVSTGKGSSQVVFIPEKEKYIRVNSFPVDKRMCGCMITDESQEFFQKNAIAALSNIYILIGVVYLKDNLVLVSKRNKDMDFSNKRIEDFDRYKNEMIERMVMENQKEKVRELLSKDFINRNLNQENSVIRYDYQGYYEQKISWCRLSLLWVCSDESGKVSEFILTVQNIQEEKENQGRERQALTDAYGMANQANHTRTEFLHTMSNEIRTPINSILGMAALADNCIEDSKKVQQYVGKITEDANQLMDIVDEIMDMSRIESRKITFIEEEISFIYVLHKIRDELKPMLDRKNQSLNITFQNLRHPDVYTDNVRFRQMVRNLIKNAIQFTPLDGKISLSLEELENKSSDIGVFRITIKDNGIGIKKEFINRIFEPFFKVDTTFTKEQEGIGLGLTIVQNMVHMMNGEIQLESEEGMGTTVILTLNLKKVMNIEEDELINYLPEENREEQVFDILEELQMTDKRAILSEDNENHRFAIREIIEKTGVAVEITKNGKEAVELYEEKPAGYYDMIFMDIQMPVMNGYDAAKTIRSMGRSDSTKIPIVAMTTNVYPEDVLLSTQAGMNEHIGKPMDIKKLKKIMINWLT